MKKLFIENTRSPGDILMLTAAIRDLYMAHNDKFLINVRTPAMQIWQNNPYLDRSITPDNCDMLIKTQTPLIHRSNIEPWHFIHGFRKFLEDKLQVTIPQGQFKVDIHLSIGQKNQKSLVEKLTGKDQRYWIINAGHKMDFTAKMWNFEKYQQVVDILKDQVLFVQVGQKNPTHIHKQLKGVVNTVGLTNDTREFIKLMYHSSGVLSPVSFAHHLATMEGRKDRIMKTRANVCIAGGRQPTNWEAYCNQAFIHRCGQFPCCDNGGCWQARTEPINDGNVLDRKLCVLPIQLNKHKVPLCMASITVQEVVDTIRRYQNCFSMYNELMNTKNRVQVIKKYYQKQRNQHIDLVKKLYNLTQKKD